MIYRWFMSFDNFDHWSIFIGMSDKEKKITNPLWEARKKEEDALRTVEEAKEKEKQIQDRRKLNRQVNTTQTKTSSTTSSNITSSNITNSKVQVTNFDMPFEDMIIFMVKWSLASIPAFIILFIIFGILFAIYAALFF